MPGTSKWSPAAARRPSRRCRDQQDRPGGLRRDRRLDRLQVGRPGHPRQHHEFTETASSAIEKVGGATRGKAILVLNPADPPLMMRDTVFALVTLPATGDATR